MSCNDVVVSAAAPTDRPTDRPTDPPTFYSMLRAGCAVRGSVIAALVLMTSATQVLAENGSVQFKAAITAKHVSCGFEVTPPETSSVTATYVKGGEGATMSSADSMDVVVTATGFGCTMNSVNVDTTYGATAFVGNSGAYGVKTSNGGLFPVHWALREVSAENIADTEVDGTFEAFDGERTRKKWKFSSTKSSRVTDKTSFSRFAQGAGGKKILHTWSGDVAGTSDAPITLRNNFSHAAWAVKGGITFVPESPARKLKLSVVPMVGVSPYSEKTHLKDDSVVEDNEILTASATMTVTAK